MWLPLRPRCASVVHFFPVDFGASATVWFWGLVPPASELNFPASC
jgi:hypothetical protein